MNYTAEELDAEIARVRADTAADLAADPPKDYLDKRIDEVIIRQFARTALDVRAEMAAERAAVAEQRAAELSTTERLMAMVNTPKPKGTN